MPQPSRDGRRARPPARRTNLVLRADHPLLRGLSDDRERRARRRLVRELLAAGLSEADVQRAVDEDRLALLPAEVVLSGRRTYAVDTLARRTGISRRQLGDFIRASGVAEQPEITARHLAMADALRAVLDAGIEEDAVLEIARVAGQGLASIARVIVRVVGETYLQAGDTEYDVGARYAEMADRLTPQLSRLIDQQLRLHILDALRQETLGRADRAEGRLPLQRDMGVAFADLVGFTRMGTRVHADAVGRVAARLVALASEVVQPPVTMVKTIGDAVMLVSPDVGRLIEDVLTLVARVGDQGEDFPQLRAGVAYGPVVGSAGDWYGHTVNLASRLTSVARPGTVVATTEVRAMTQGRVSWSYALPRHLRGMRGAVSVAKVRGLNHHEAG
jgi:adenylate cyclase